MAEDRIRVLRVLEYVGSRSFVEKSLELRTVKGRFYPSVSRRPGDYIQDAILGETAEILSQSNPQAVTDCGCDPSKEPICLCRELRRAHIVNPKVYTWDGRYTDESYYDPPSVGCGLLKHDSRCPKASTGVIEDTNA